MTGLPNRHQFEATPEDVLDRRQAGALLFIDLDGFKDVNDTLGLAVGDQLLLLVAGRLRSQLREEDTIARVGGDEFVAILPSTSDREDTLAYGERILNSLSTSYLIGKDRIDISASIGLSRFPEDGDTVDILLRNADVAMYQAKHNGKGRLLSFDKDLADEIRQRTQLQSVLLIAIEQNQLELHYQPQVCCLSGTVKGVEALLRWTHLKHGTISPAIFIPIAEKADQSLAKMITLMASGLGLETVADPIKCKHTLINALTLVPEAGAQCVSSARWDLREGCRVTGIPIATVVKYYVMICFFTRIHL